MPDGGSVLFSAASAEVPFRIYRVDVATGVLSRLERTGASAQSPAISSDGQRLVFVGLEANSQAQLACAFA